MKSKLQLAGCVILDEKGRVLLLHRETSKRVQWETPGGKVEPGESEKQAAVREVKEELGVDVKILKDESKDYKRGAANFRAGQI